jgi:hypothetical protein
MGTVAVILGLAGVLLLLAGLIGGGFSFSGSVIPVVSGAARIPCFFIGGLLITVSILMAAVEFIGPAEPAASTTDPAPTTATPASVEPWVGYLVTSANVHQSPALDSTAVGQLEAGTPVEILCTAQGDTVTRTADGVTSSLWDRISAGYVPDVAIDTGTDQATMGPC